MSHAKRNTNSATRFALVSLLAGIVLFAFVLVLFPTVRAVTIEDPSATLGLGTADLKDTVIRFINWALGFLGIIAVGFVLYGGYMWLTSGGNKDRIETAKKILINTSIGLVIIIFSWAIVNFIIRTTDELIGGGGDVCTTGERDGCYVCSDGTWLYDGAAPGCTLPVEQFEIRSITTTCSAPPAYHEDVYRCSAVSVNFNHLVDTTTLESLVESDVSVQLTLAQCDDGSACTTTSQPSPLFSPSLPHIEYSGSTPTGDRAEFIAGGRSISFLHGHELFAENTYYQLTVPKTVRDVSGRTVSACERSDGSVIPSCTETETAFEWVFRVGAETDTVAPTLSASYPTSEAGNPDRNVTRNPIIWARFSEAIAPWTVTEASVTVSPLSGSVNPDGSGGTVEAPLSNDTYDVFLNEDGNGVEFVLSDGESFNAFAWYQVTVRDLADMCLNTQAPPIVSWRFQTNGLSAGIAQTYPSDGFQRSCIDTEMFVLFNTSLYDPRTASCAVGVGYVESGSTNPSVPRSLQVEDGLPPGGDPNEYCKKYGFKPVSGELEYDTSYSVTVSTRYPTDREGGTLDADWDFRTASDAASCANQPYIERLSPSTGGIGQCLTVIGNYFDRAPPEGKGVGDSLTFTGTSAESLNWADRSIVTTAPSIGGLDPDDPTPSPVQVTVTYPGDIGVLSSNTVDFVYQPGEGPTDGPCLESIQPPDGSRGQGFRLNGLRFDPDSSTKIIHFGGTDLSVDWPSDTAANASVPETAEEERVHLLSLQNDAGKSNALPFFVHAIPPGSFSILDAVPTCGTACQDASVRARFSSTLNPSSITSDTVELYRCPSAACDTGLTEDTTVDLEYEGTRDVYFSPHDGLIIGQHYRTVVKGGESGVRSADDRLLNTLNYDTNGDAVVDAYSWTFGTTDSVTGCSLSRVAVEPDTASVAIGRTRNFSGFGYTDPNECNPSGEELNPYVFTWNWSSSDATRASVSPTSGPPATVATGLAPTVAPVEIRGAVDAHRDAGLLSVLPIDCVTDADCDTTPGDGFCDGSRCLASICTPVVDSISPVSGTVGTWVSVFGCNFNTYRDGASSVTFLQNEGDLTDDRPGLWPSPAICGSPGTTWTDTQIITEVPNQTTGGTGDDVTLVGPLRVTRGSDGVQTVSSGSFDPTGEEHPGICRVTPTSGQVGVTNITIDGTNFGSAQTPGSDFVTFYNGQEVGSAETTWEGETRIRATVPVGATNNETGGEIIVTNDGVTSNEADFTVVPASCEICSVDTDCGEGGDAGIYEGCGIDGPLRCCSARPRPQNLHPRTPPTVCRNAALSGDFHQVLTPLPMAMDTSTINPSTFTVTRVNDGAFVPLDASDFRFPDASHFIVNPGLLDADTEYEVTVRGDVVLDGVPTGVLNTESVGVYGNYSWRFTTSDSLCEIDAVRLSPSSLFFTDLGSTQSIQATAYTGEGVPIFPVAGLYDWEWVWSTENGSIATVTTADGDSDGRVDDTQAVASVGNGDTLTKVEARALAGWSGSVSASANTSVSVCEQPWPAHPPYIDHTGPSANFSLWYCRDSGAPNFNSIIRTFTPSDPGSDELLKEFFFENPNVNPETNKHDAVGLLIWENADRLSPSAWYEKKFSDEVSSASSDIDGYDAMRIGTTTYIAGTNLSDGTLYTNMYVVGYNGDASAETLFVVQEMMDSFSLNINEGDFAYAETSAPTALEQVRRDTKRITALGEYSRALDAYGLARGSFPALESGTYLSGMSTSVWPSWSETFGADLRSSVPSEAVTRTDPLNTFSPSCADISPGYDPATCWDEREKKFLCPADSHIYAYQSSPTESTYNLFGHLEYRGQGSWQTGDINPCSGSSACACFNYALSGVEGLSSSEDITPPTTPESVAATGVSADSITLSWSGSSDEGGSGVSSYRTYRSGDDESFVYVDAVTVGTTTWTDAGLSPETTLFYRVSAVDFQGNESAPSVSVRATTSAESDTEPPQDVRNPTVTEEYLEAYVTQWEEPSDEDYVGVALYRKEGSGAFARTDAGAVLVANVPRGTTTHRDTDGWRIGFVYTYGFFAYDSASNYAGGVFATIEPAGSVYDDELVGLRFTPGDTVIDFTWTNPANPDYAGVMIRRSETGEVQDITDGVLLADVPKTQTSFHDSGLVNGFRYYYRFFAHDAAPNYTTGTYTSVVPVSGGYSDMLAGFWAAGGNQEVLLTWWNPATLAYAGAVIRRSTTGYPTSPTTGDFVADIVVGADPNDRYLNTGLENDVTYYYAAFPYNTDRTFGTGSFGSATPNESPPHVTSVTVPPASITDDDATIRWTTSEPSYTIVSIQGIGYLFDLSSLREEHSVRVNDYYASLDANTSNIFQILVMDAEGNDTFDEERTVVTDADDASGLTWEGYYAGRRLATWNGSANPAVCGEQCNQFYVCLPDGTPNCSDPRNGGAQNPGATTTCGALAYADCLDGVAHLPQGPQGTLTASALNGWSGSRLPLQSEYGLACGSADAPLGMPYTNGTWTGRPAGSGEAKAVGRDATCGTVSDVTVSDSSVPFNIVAP